MLYYNSRIYKYNHIYTAATICNKILLILKTNWAICNVFEPIWIATCTFFFMAFLVIFFSSTSSNMDVSFILFRLYQLCHCTVGMELKYSFSFRPKAIVQFKLFKIVSDTSVTVNCDYKRGLSLFAGAKQQKDSPVTIN